MYEAVLAVRGPRSGARPRGGAGSKMRGGSVRLSRCMTGRTPRPVPGFPLHVLRCSGPGAGRHVVAGDMVLQRTPASRSLACQSGPLGASWHRREAGGLDVPGATPSRAYARLLGRAVHDRFVQGYASAGTRRTLQGLVAGACCCASLHLGGAGIGAQLRGLHFGAREVPRLMLTVEVRSLPDSQIPEISSVQADKRRGRLNLERLEQRCS